MVIVFSTTPGEVDLAKYFQDIDNFAHKIRWAYRFFINPSDPNDFIDIERSVIPKTNTYPASKTDNMALELYLKKVTDELKNPKLARKSYDNLKPSERAALKELRDSKDIVIRRFDKGKGWIIDDKESYVNRMTEHLSDDSTFEYVENPSTIIDEIISTIRVWTGENEEHLSSKLMSNLIDESSRPGYAYGNYKAHKPASNYPLRVITSGCGSPVQRLSSYVEYHLHPLVATLDYVIIDTPHFLRTIKTFNNNFDGEFEKVMLVTWDVEKMYDSIDNELGVESCREALDQRDRKIPPTDSLIEALTIVLNNNVSVSYTHLTLPTKA